MADHSSTPEKLVDLTLPESHVAAIRHYLSQMPGSRGPQHDLTHPEGILAEIDRTVSEPYDPPSPR